MANRKVLFTLELPNTISIFLILLAQNMDEEDDNYRYLLKYGWRGLESIYSSITPKRWKVVSQRWLGKCPQLCCHPPVVTSWAWPPSCCFAHLWSDFLAKPEPARELTLWVRFESFHPYVAQFPEGGDSCDLFFGSGESDSSPPYRCFLVQRVSGWSSASIIVETFDLVHIGGVPNRYNNKLRTNLNNNEAADRGSGRRSAKVEVRQNCNRAWAHSLRLQHSTR